ncbi:hypothetical protein N2152v2_004724 [Parachlorella kessleri]
MPLAISLPAASRPSLRQLLNRWKNAATGGGCGSGSSGSGNGGLGDPSRRVTDILLVANVALFGLQFFTKQALTAWGHKSNQLIVAGQWWRLLTSAFLHADVFHLWLNCSALNNLGPLMEDRMGRPRYIATYLVAAVAGSLASFIGCPSPSLGASGAIFGVGGAMAVYFHRNKDHYGEASVLILGQLFKNLLINVLYGIMSRRRRIDHWHLKELLEDDSRTEAMIQESNGIYLDFSRQNATPDTVKLLLDLANRAGLKQKVADMFAGKHINSTEDRAVLHVALRAPRDAEINDGGKNVVPEVWEVLDKIKAFSDKVRGGQWVGVTGKPLTNVVAIGIGGSYLGPLFVHTALATHPEAMTAASGRRLEFLANVDPVDSVTALGGLDPETTLVVIVSKTFTTAETMLNARTARAWLTDRLGPESVAKHMVAVSTNLKLVAEFGIDPANAFGFWDWVGGRYSVSSAVGVLPLSLQYGFEITHQFLRGMHDIDAHFASAPLESNLPVLLGLLNVWNATFLGHPTVAVLPYQQALAKFAPHIQQLSMESNGKGVNIDGECLNYEAGEIDFGEPGTNGQHSFYQLVHQGRVVPAEFVGVVRSQQDVYLKGEKVSSHEELMCNFFAQPDALALGKDAAQLRAEGVPEHLVSHKTFTGNRPSISLLLPELSAFTLGQLLGLYEHRVAVSGFVWGINSFDQWGVELGKVLATKVRAAVASARAGSNQVSKADGFNGSTVRLLNRFLATPTHKAEGAHLFPPGLKQ